MQYEVPQSITESHPLNPSSLSVVDTWYRSFRPDFDIDELPLETHIDAVASSVLLSARVDIPSNPESRISSALEMTTMGGNKLVGMVATEGKAAFPLLDLLTELPERKTTPSPSVTLRLLNFGVRTALSIRENPLLSAEDRIAANSKLANLRLAELKFAQQHVPEQVKDYSDRYINIVRQEALFNTELIKRILR